MYSIGEIMEEHLAEILGLENLEALGEFNSTRDEE